MVRISGALVVLQVAGNACSAAQVVVVVGMAIRALPRRNGVPSAERKSYGVVIEGRIQPVIGSMTVIAGRRKHRRHMVGIACGLKILGMAGIALRRHRLKLAVRRTFVA